MKHLYRLAVGLMAFTLLVAQRLLLQRDAERIIARAQANPVLP